VISWPGDLQSLFSWLTTLLLISDDFPLPALLSACDGQWSSFAAGDHLFILQLSCFTECRVFLLSFDGLLLLSGL
jgi:hypothetical protein